MSEADQAWALTWGLWRGPQPFASPEPVPASELARSIIRMGMCSAENPDPPQESGSGALSVFAVSGS